MKLWKASYGWPMEGPVEGELFTSKEAAEDWLNSKKGEESNIGYGLTFHVDDVLVFDTATEAMEWREFRSAERKHMRFLKYGDQEVTRTRNTQLSDQLKELLDDAPDPSDTRSTLKDFLGPED